ncbi:MAG: UPF0182 family membrane protein [Actinomycetota bacterium]
MMSQSPPRVSRRAIALGAAVVLILVLIGSTRFFTDVLWFNEVGFTSVLWTSLRAQFFTGLVIGVLTALIIWVSLWIAARVSPTYVIPRMAVAGREDPMSQYRDSLLPYLKWIRLAAAAGVGFLSGIAAATAWQTVLLWLNRVSFGEVDPQFGKDISFYMFELPLYDQAADWLWFAVVSALILSIGSHYLSGAIRPELGLRGIVPGALAHISVLLGVLALIKSLQYYLGTFQLNFSPRGTVTGASYTDVNAQLPALYLLAIISIISAVLFIVNIRFRTLRLPLAAFGIWVLVAVLAGGVWPMVVQRFSVEPQEPQRERPYIERNLAATRTGFGLSEVTRRNYPALRTLSEEEIRANEGMLRNVRLWDYGILQRAYAQLQAIRTYYQFHDVDIDRYEIDGEARQVLLSARELSISDIPEQSQSWQNVHLQYTHGFGLVASLANESTSAGQPQFLVRDAPGILREGAETLDLEQPRIYFGEGFAAHEYSIVNSEQDELDYPIEGGVQRSNYEGQGGIALGNIFQRLAFAIRERDPNLVLSGLINPDSRILIYRNVRDRVLRAAPFLDLDGDPYPAVVDGRLVWILDGYTSSPWYPYAERYDAGQIVGGAEAGRLNGAINYIRNPVKITLDAYDGELKFYIVDPDDPLIQAYQKAFPSLFATEEPSEDLRAHFRYPEDLFKVQSSVYGIYHMEDPENFYSREDAWDIPPAPRVGDFDTTLESELSEPVYLLFQPPGSVQQEFVLTRPFLPRRRPNMISMLIASSDPHNYGQLVSLEFPRSSPPPGPQQVNNLINQDVTIKRLLTLLSQEGSTVQFGALVTLPIEEAILYIQPIYITAERGGIPELKKVVVALGEDLVMEDTLEQALERLFELDEGAIPDVSSDDDDEVDEEDPSDPVVSGELRALVEEAQDLYERAQQALAAGEFQRYGRLIEELGRILQEAQEFSGSS